MGNTIGRYFNRRAEQGKYGDLIVRLPEGDAAVTYGFPHEIGDKVRVFVYRSNNQNGNKPTGFFAEVVEVKRNNLRASTGV